MTGDEHVPVEHLRQIRMQAAIDQVRAEVRDLVGLVGRHLEAGCLEAGCPGMEVISRLTAVTCGHRFDVAVATLIVLAERDAEITALRKTGAA